MFNYSAIYSIIAYKVKEFFSEYQYSLLAPITTNLLFVLVFLTIESYYSLSIDSNSFVQFIAPGLIIMIVAQESYNNPSVTLVNMKQIKTWRSPSRAKLEVDKYQIKLNDEIGKILTQHSDKKIILQNVDEAMQVNVAKALEDAYADKKVSNAEKKKIMKEVLDVLKSVINLKWKIF